MMKKTKPVSNSLFWLKHILLALIIIVIAGIILIMTQSNELTVGPEGNSDKKSISKSVSDFYENYRLTSRHPREEALGDFVMEVKMSEQTLDERLEKMESLEKPVSQRWVGDHKHRSFKAGSTLRSAITNYAQSEGMQVIWELDQDFIVKHPFQLDDSILGSLQMIAKTIDSNFDGEVKAYMCPRQRSMVITSKSTDYLEKQCEEARK
jgi:hypothetical protein